ncbi:MAG: tRNA lysidine(34) synthetase TilS [Candidatus Gallimonas sp.]
MIELFPLSPYRHMRLCVALSGGRDSVALLHYLRAHADESAITLSAVTCEHGIRGEESLRDLRFVKALCADWQIPLEVFSEDVPALAARTGMGLEEAGREFRYGCFRTIVNSGRADAVATAHHLDDYAETVLFRLSRGTSLSGMNAFRAQDGILRPMLGVTRAEVDAYVAENALPFVEDSTNADGSYTRNYLRNEVLPALRRAIPRAPENLVRFAARAAEDDAYLTELAQELVAFSDGEAEIAVGLPSPIFTRACILAMKSFGIRRDYTSANVEEIAALRTLQSGRKVNLPDGLEAAREHGKIVFYRPKTPFFGEVAFTVGARIELFDGVFVETGEGEREGALRADLDRFPGGCVVRTRREGDVFTPYGGARKKLKEFLTDRKIPARKGAFLPLIACGNEILAVVGVEVSDRVKITPTTMRRGYIQG